MQGHVALGSYAPSTAPITPTRAGAGVVPNTVALTSYGQMGQAPVATMGKMGPGCRRRRMGKAGTRCFCNGKLVKSGRCK